MVSSYLLGLELLFHFLHLFSHSDVVRTNAIEFTKTFGGFVNLALSVVEPRSLGEQEDAESEDKGLDEADTHDDPPRGRTLNVFRPKINEICDKDATDSSRR